MHEHWEKAHKLLVKEAERSSVAELSRKIGVNRKTIDAWCAGSYPGVDILGKIAAALNCQPWELLKPEGAKPTQDPLLARVVAVWGRLEDDDRRAITRLAESLAKADAQAVGPLTKQEKPGS